MGKETKLSVDEISQLLELVKKFSEQGHCTAAEAVQRISTILSPESSEQTRSRAVLADYAARVRQLRMRRNELIGAPLCRDPAWDMLLELFAAHESGRKLSVSSLCYASGVPLTTALRHVDRLEEHGLITRHGDSSDQRRWFVEPTGKAVAGVASAAAALLEQSQALESIDGDQDEAMA